MESDTEREGFSICPSKGQHSTGYHLGCLVAGVSCHPTAGIGKVQRELLVRDAGWGTEPGVWLPRPPAYCEEKKKRFEMGASGLAMIRVIWTMSPSSMSPKTTRAASSTSPSLQPSTAGSPFWPLLLCHQRQEQDLAWAWVSPFALPHLCDSDWGEAGTTHWWGKGWGFSQELVWNGVGLGCMGVTGDSISGSEKWWDLVHLENWKIREKEYHRVILL